MVLNKAEFDRHAQRGANRIPLMREVLADLDTPLSTYLKLAYGPYSYLFESVQGGEIALALRKVRTRIRPIGSALQFEALGKVEHR